MVSRHVLLCVLKRFSFHPFDLLARQPVRGDDLDAGALPASLFGCGNVQDAVLIDQECYVDFGYARRHGRNPAELEDPERSTVLDEFSLALQHVDLDADLTVLKRCETLARLTRDAYVVGDQLAHRSAHRFDAQR